jgi:hypothetical protein
MSRTIKFFSIALTLILIALSFSCASANKNTYYEKRKKASHVNSSQLGRNKYFFSTGYQKKLNKSYKGK